MPVQLIEVDPNKLLDTKDDNNNDVKHAKKALQNIARRAQHGGTHLHNHGESAVRHTHYCMTPFEKYNIDEVEVRIRTEKYFDDEEGSLLKKCSLQKEVSCEKSRELLISKRCTGGALPDELQYYESVVDNQQRQSVCLAEFTVKRFMIAHNDDFQHYVDVCAYYSPSTRSSSYYTVVSLKVFNADSELLSDYKQRMEIARSGAPLVPAPSKFMHYLERERPDLYSMVAQQHPQHMRATSDVAVSTDDPTDDFHHVTLTTGTTGTETETLTTGTETGSVTTVVREWIACVRYGRLASLVEYRINDRKLTEMSFDELMKTFKRAHVLAEPDEEIRVSLIVLYEELNMSSIDLNAYDDQELLLSQCTPELMTEMSIPKLIGLADCVADESLRADIWNRIERYSGLCAIAAREVSRLFTKFHKYSSV